MSEFVYHAVVDLLPGTDALLPVSALRGIDEAAYRRAISKYDDTSSEVSRFDPERFQTAMQAPPANRAWLASLAAAGRRGAWFNRTPHVVTAGPVLLGAATTVSSDAAPAP